MPPKACEEDFTSRHCRGFTASPTLWLTLPPPPRPRAEPLSPSFKRRHSLGRGCSPCSKWEQQPAGFITWAKPVKRNCGATVKRCSVKSKVILCVFSRHTGECQLLFQREVESGVGGVVVVLVSLCGVDSSCYGGEDFFLGGGWEG